MFVKNNLYRLIVFASLVFAFFVITFGAFPYLGISISFSILTAVAYIAKSEKSKLSKFLFGITFVLSLFLGFRSEGVVTFFNFFGALLFGLLAMTVTDNEPTFRSLILNPINDLFRSIFVENLYHSNSNNKHTSKTTGFVNSILIGLLTLVILIIIVPVLASANPLFQKLVDNSLNFLGINLKSLPETLFLWLIRLVIFFVLVLFLPKFATAINTKGKIQSIDSIKLNLLVPKIAVSIVLAIFFITQYQLYFATPDSLASLGYTNSQLTREVFAQLSFVAFVVLVLLYNDNGTKKVNKVMNYILGLMGIFLTFMAFKSVYDYSHLWGFTYKRLYGFTAASFILGVFFLYLQNKSKGAFVAKTLVFTGLMLIVINLLNFDYLIYKSSKPRTSAGVDYYYLTHLSADSLSYKEQLTELEKISLPYPKEDYYRSEHLRALRNTIYNIEALQFKYKNLNFRSLNLLEYRQYQDIKDINTKTYRDKYFPMNP